MQRVLAERSDQRHTELRPTRMVAVIGLFAFMPDNADHETAEASSCGYGDRADGIEIASCLRLPA